MPSIRAPPAPGKSTAALSLSAEPALRSVAEAVVPELGASVQHVSLTLSDLGEADVRLVLGPSAPGGETEPVA